MILTPQDKALDMFNNAVKFVTLQMSVNAEFIKPMAKDYALNQIVRIKAALYECTQIDSYTPHKSIEFYNSVREIISNF